MTAPALTATEAEVPGGRVAALHRAFRALLVALSYPGRRVPVASTGDAALDLLLLSTWEPGCRLATAGAPLTPPWRCSPVDAGDADLLIVGGPSSGGALTRLPRGDAARPERGATAIYAVGGDVAAVPVRLRGPGVRDRLDTELPLAAAELMARDTACADWPLGVDVAVVDAAGWLIGLPRTTRVERR